MQVLHTHLLDFFVCCINALYVLIHHETQALCTSESKNSNPESKMSNQESKRVKLGKQKVQQRHNISQPPDACTTCVVLMSIYHTTTEPTPSIPQSHIAHKTSSKLAQPWTHPEADQRPVEEATKHSQRQQFQGSSILYTSLFHTVIQAHASSELGRKVTSKVNRRPLRSLPMLT